MCNQHSQGQSQCLSAVLSLQGLQLSWKFPPLLQNRHLQLGGTALQQAPSAELPCSIPGAASREQNQEKCQQQRKGSQYITSCFLAPETPKPASASKHSCRDGLKVQVLVWAVILTGLELSQSSQTLPTSCTSCSNNINSTEPLGQQRAGALSQRLLQEKASPKPAAAAAGGNSISQTQSSSCRKQLTASPKLTAALPHLSAA